MNKLLKVTISILLVVATVCFIGCKKTDEPINGGNNENNDGNGSETPEIPTIVSTSEVQYDGTVYVEAVFDDESKMYFEILSPTEVALVNGEFYYQDNPSLAYIYRGDVVIPETITHLGTTYSVVSIAKKAFYRNEMVTSVYIPNTVITINSFDNSNYSPDQFYILGAFQECSNLRDVHMSENIQIIAAVAFYGCPFDTITIPKYVKQIGSKAFDSETIIFNADSCFVAGNGGSAFPKMKSISFGSNVKVLPAYLFHDMNPAIVDIPSSVTVIPEQAFIDCNNLERINNLENVLEIGKAAFDRCESLVSVALNSSLVEIKDYTFYNCINLTRIDVPDSVIKIGKQAFFHCDKIVEISLPSSLQIINSGAFAFSNSSTNNTIITCKAINPPILGERVFEYRQVEVMYVPMASVEAYKTADGWSGYADVIVGI